MHARLETVRCRRGAAWTWCATAWDAIISCRGEDAASTSLPAYASTLVGYACASRVQAHAVLYRPEPASLAKIPCQRSVRHGTDDAPGLPGAPDRSWHMFDTRPVAPGGPHFPQERRLPLPSGTRKRPFFPPQRVEGGVTLVDVDKGVGVGEHRHGCVAPVVVSATGKKDGEARRVPRCTLRHTALTLRDRPCSVPAAGGLSTPGHVSRSHAVSLDDRDTHGMVTAGGPYNRGAAFAHRPPLAE